MDHEESFALLGLNPGASTEDIKKAFRSRIKACHPDRADSPSDNDRARKLIEAYRVLKEEPPPIARRRTAPRAGFRPRSSSAARPSAPPHHNPFRSRAFQEDISRYARAAGQRLYEEVFRSGRNNEPFSIHEGVPLETVWEKLSEEIWGDGEDVMMYGENINVREFRRSEGRSRARTEYRTRPESESGAAQKAAASGSGLLTPGEIYYERAESLLRDTVQKYDSVESLKRKLWVREYMSHLNNIQVLFRDVANRHPSLSYRALQRVRQIGELTGELKRML